METELTRDEVNRYIHERMGHCVADWEVASKPCPGCGGENYFDEKHSDPPDYCSDSSPRLLLNEVVAAVIVTPKGWNALYRHVNLQLKSQQQIIEATAEQIARACVEAWEAREDGQNN